MLNSNKDDCPNTKVRCTYTYLDNKVQCIFSPSHGASTRRDLPADAEPSHARRAASWPNGAHHRIEPLSCTACSAGIPPTAAAPSHKAHLHVRAGGELPVPPPEPFSPTFGTLDQVLSKRFGGLALTADASLMHRARPNRRASTQRFPLCDSALGWMQSLATIPCMGCLVCYEPSFCSHGTVGTQGNRHRSPPNAHLRHHQ